MTKLSFSTNAFVRYSIEEAVAHIADSGYSGVELLADVPHLYPSNVTDSGLAAIQSSLRERNLRVVNINANTAVGYYQAKFWEPLFEPSLANPDKEKRKWRVEYTKRCIDIARFFSCPNVSITSGRMVPGVRPGKSLEYLKESLAEVLGYAAEKNVRIGMEYEPGLLVECFDELRDLIRYMDSEFFGANLDLGHSHVLGEDPKEVIEGLASRIFHVHIEDIRCRKHYHLIPGEGDVDFRELFRLLDATGYDGFASVELYTYSEDPINAAKKAFDFLNPLISRQDQ